MKQRLMNWHSFIFSEKKSHRAQRHVAFWSLWWIYFIITYFYYQQTGLQQIESESWNAPFFLKSVLLLSIHVVSCYCFIGFVLPRYLLKEQYAKLIIAAFLLSLGILLASYYMHRAIFPLVNAAFNYHPRIVNPNLWWTSISSGLFTAPKVIAVATAITLLKRWYLKQKEKERLDKEKLMTDLQLLKAQIHPKFLFSSLDNIYALTQKKNTEKASLLLLKLADILSYMLYDTDSALVPLEKEIKIIKDYLSLQKTMFADLLEIDIAEKGQPTDRAIAPLLLLPLIENSFLYIENKNLEPNWINLEFQVEAEELTMKVIHGKSIESLPIDEEQMPLTKTRKRLDFFYPDRYELKTTDEPEMMMIYLKVDLGNTMNEKKTNIYLEQIDYATA
jgi:two-component system, LytTR family, sensor kinase